MQNEASFKNEFERSFLLFMNDLMKSTITTMEVADMMEISHNDI